MRKIALSFLFLSMSLSPLYAKTEAASIPQRSADEEKKITEIRKRVEEKKTELNGSSWELILNSSDPKEKKIEDTFTFQNGQFKSKNLENRGFVSTNYTISVPSADSETAVWETMQTGKEGVVFVRGEWEKETMRGDITEQLDGGKKVKGYYFTTTSRLAISPTSKEEEKAGSSKTDAAALAGTVSNESKVLVSKEAKPVEKSKKATKKS